MANIRIINKTKVTFSVNVGNTIINISPVGDPKILKYVFKNSTDYLSCLSLILDMSDSPVHRRYVILDADEEVLLDTKYIGCGKFPNVPLTEGSTYSLDNVKIYKAYDFNKNTIGTLKYEDTGDEEDLEVTFDDVINLSSPVYVKTISLEKVYPINSEFTMMIYLAPFEGKSSIDTLNYCNKDKAIWEE